MTAVYDAGALIAADRSERRVWAEHRVRLELGVPPITTAPVVAQASRSGRQAQLRRFLRGCDLVEFSTDDAHAVGELAGRSKSADVVDVHVVLVASRHGWPIVTSDEGDLRPIVEALPTPLGLLRP